MTKLKGLLPEVTPVRSLFAALAAWCISTFGWYYTRSRDIPAFVVRTHIPVWALRNWPVAIFPVFIFATLVLLLKGFTYRKTPEELNPKALPGGDNRELSTRQVFDLQDAQQGWKR
jgi:hypothetical protein